MKDNQLIIYALIAAGIYFLTKNTRPDPIKNPPPIEPERGVTDDIIKWLRVMREIYGFTKDTIDQLWGPGGPFHKKLTNEQIALITQAYAYI